jgi:hypothetical protein
MAQKLILSAAAWKKCHERKDRECAGRRETVISLFLSLLLFFVFFCSSPHLFSSSSLFIF